MHSLQEKYAQSLATLASLREKENQNDWLDWLLEFDNRDVYVGLSELLLTQSIYALEEKMNIERLSPIEAIKDGKYQKSYQAKKDDLTISQEILSQIKQAGSTSTGNLLEKIIPEELLNIITLDAFATQALSLFREEISQE